MSEPIKIKLKLFDKTLPLPKKHSPGAACFDLYSRVEITVRPKTIEYIPLNVAIAAPEGYWVLLAPRSSLHKHGLMMANSVGIIDNDYSGDDDEYILTCYNFTDEAVTIEKGQRIAQATVLPILDIEIEQVDTLKSTARGGFGTTGKL